ncbi:MAG TPA: fumarylacetoacetate hydrolase family protein [Candidatus Limnocylindrales bacterium]|nr:fumarylacetoacetate hydrolase family protein [Candidatus Limnocylindrales bacterium]
MIALLRFRDPEHGVRIGVRLDEAVHDVTDSTPTLGHWLRASAGRMHEALVELEAAARTSGPCCDFSDLLGPPSAHARYLLAAVDEQDVWAAGVTYARSRDARQEEAVDGGDVYSRVYAAERPELFFKAQGRWVVGPWAAVGIRRDSAWNVPEPELTLVLNPALEVVGMTIGNDMSSRDIEGANPLYLPQAKVYTASCALGPQWVLGPLDSWPQVEIRIAIERVGRTVVQDQVATSRIHRRVGELVEHLGRCMRFDDGVLLMSGTGIVPAPDFSLQAGDVVTIEIDGIGTLTNPVEVV